MGRPPRGFLNDFRSADSVADLLKRKGWEKGHEAGRIVCPDYTTGMEILIERELPNERSSSQSTLEKNLRDLDRCLREPRLPFPQEQIPDKSIEEQIELLESRWPAGLWETIDRETGEVRVITVSDIVASPSLRDEALAKFHKRASKLKDALADANWDLALVANLLARLERLPAPTESEIRAFYGSGAWAAKRAEVLDRDGLHCAECKTFDDPFEVDHDIPIRECWPLRLVRSNLRALCIICHRRKHAQKEAAE